MKFKLEEKLWKYTIPSKYGTDIIDAEEGQDDEGVTKNLRALVAFIKSDIIRNNEDMEFDFEDIEETVEQSAIIEAADYNGDYEAVDDVMNDIYDFCDTWGVWFTPAE